MTELRRGLRRWALDHPECPPEGWISEEGIHWGPSVGYVYLEAPDALVLIDPLTPPDGTADARGFWELLESDTARTGHSLDVILTLANEWMSHVRSAPEIVARYPSTSVWAPVGAREEMLKRTQVVTSWFEPGDALPGGVEAYATALPGEVVLWLSVQRALVPADVIDGTADGGLCVIPDSSLAEGVTAAAQRESLRALLDLPIDLVLVSHGDPVLSNGHEALAKALAF
jgi:glyoxylase-like metal-dependent hydrolase (beta-lactamase superfamily II)